MCACGYSSSERPCGLERAFGGVEIADFAEQKPQTAQHRSGDAVAGGDGVIAEGLAAMNEPLVVGGREEKPAAIGVGKLSSA